MATNAARYRMVAGKHIKLLEFGLRRAQGPDGGLSASKYSYIGESVFNLLIELYEIEVFDIQFMNPLNRTLANLYILSNFY